MKKAMRLIATIMAVIVVTITTSLLVEGVPLLGVPMTDDIAYVLVQHGNYPNEIKKYTDAQSIELSVALLGYLRYSPLKGLSDDQQLIKITYIMKDESERVVSVNSSTVWWNEKPHALKNENTFVKMCTGLFFAENG